MLLAALAGAAIATQAAANGSLKVNLGDARYAAFFSICGTMLTALFAICVFRPPFPSVALMRATPWWNWIGGPLGASIVLSGAFITAVVTGQVICSLGLDHFGVLGIPQHSITLGRSLGAGMIITGMLFVKYL